MRRPKLTFSFNQDSLTRLIAQARRERQEKEKYKLFLGTAEEYAKYLERTGGRKDV